MSAFIYLPPPDKYLTHIGPRHVNSVSKAPWVQRQNPVQTTIPTDLLGRPPSPSFPLDPPLPDDGPDPILPPLNPSGT
jgi:hypothetical protein